MTSHLVPQRRTSEKRQAVPPPHPPAPDRLRQEGNAAVCVAGGLPVFVITTKLGSTAAPRPAPTSPAAHGESVTPHLHARGTGRGCSLMEGAHVAKHARFARERDNGAHLRGSRVTRAPSSLKHGAAPECLHSGGACRWGWAANWAGL